MALPLTTGERHHPRRRVERKYAQLVRTIHTPVGSGTTVKDPVRDSMKIGVVVSLGISNRLTSYVYPPAARVPKAVLTVSEPTTVRTMSPGAGALTKTSTEIESGWTNARLEPDTLEHIA